MTQRSRAIGILVLLCGAMLLAGGITCALLYLMIPFSYQGPDLLATNLTIASVAAIGLVFGIALTHHARNFLKARTSAVFHPPSPRRLTAIFVVSVIVGQLILSFVPSSRLTSLVFPLFHIAAATTPALAILGFVGRRTRAASWRTVTLEVSHGALLAPAIALVAELMVILALILVASVVVVLTPGGMETLLELSSNLQDPSWLEDPENLASLVLSPATLAAIIAVFVFFAPLIEEFVKGLGVLLLGSRLRARAEALLWGVACGAGFAMGESLFNGSIALEGWGVVMLMRWGASLMHCVASGVMGLAWYHTLSTRRPWRLLAAYAAASGVHALWNALAVAVALPSLLLVTRPEDVSVQTIAALTIAGAAGLLFLLIICMVILMVSLIGRAHEASSKETLTDEELPSGSGAA
ncbi:MAG TPA: PrsW family glutamic-type intramembrane protease [Anaerolineae bacterium]|nr:PrsW family glutamic-type intramembrane protease [Anaerolineae bacterium]